MLLDIHCHLTHKLFEQDVDKVIKRSGEVIIVCAGSGLIDNQKVLALASKHSNVKASLGFYPWDAVNSTDEQINGCINFMKNNKSKAVIIGEVGLDHHWGQSKVDWAKQELVFRRLLKFCDDNNKPVLIHCRDAEAIVLKVISDYSCNKVIHCYTGPLSLVPEFLSRDCYFTIPALIAKSKSFVKLCKKLPVNRLLTETDSPYLSPVQLERNEPVNVRLGLEVISKLKDLSFKDCEEQVFKNYESLTRD